MSEPAAKTPAERLSQLGGRGGGLESGLESDAGLNEDRIRRSLEMLDAVLAREVVENERTPLDEEAARRFHDAAETGLRRLAGDGPRAQLELEHQIGLEAVIETDGSRPSALIQDGFLDVTDPRLGDWQGDLIDYRGQIEAAIASTGRLLVDGETSELSVAGTAFMVAKGRAATAKHVIEQTFVRHGANDWFPPFGRTLELDFHVEADRPSRPQDRIRVTGVHWASPDEIGHSLDLGNFDLAILELAEDGPPPLTVAKDLSFPAGEPRIHVIGHPKRPVGFGLRSREEFEEILGLVFGDSFGVKRWSPGIVKIGPGHLPGDTETKRVMTHDASTLGGNSGSPVFDMSHVPDRLIGLHYGGFFEKENYAHAGPALAERLGLAGARLV